MKLFHASDLHYCEKHLDWVDRAFGFAVDQAIERGAKVGVLSGDTFDAALPLHHPAVDRCVRQVRRLADAMPVLILQGTFSHDRLGAVDIFKHLRSRYPIYVADDPAQVLLANGDTAPVWIDNAAMAHYTNAVLFSVLPSINRAEIQAATPDTLTGDYVLDLCQHWARTNLEARAHGIPTVLVSHGTVNGCRTETKQAMVSQDHEFSTGTLFAARTSAVMLGHIHLHQSWELHGRKIAYPGSVARLVFGHDAPVGCLIWDVTPNTADFEFIAAPSRRMVEIEFDGPPDMVALRAKLADCRGAHVRVRYTVDEEHRQSVDVASLRDALQIAGVAEHKIEATVNPVVRTRAAGIHQAATVAEKLARWCDLTNTPAAPLQARLTQLEQSV